MKKNNLIDKKVISAMLVGISAMMAISSPITAYAEGEDAPANDNTEPGTEETAAVEAQPETTAEAQQQAEVAENAIEDIATELAPIIADEETKAGRGEITSLGAPPVPPPQLAKGVGEESRAACARTDPPLCCRGATTPKSRDQGTAAALYETGIELDAFIIPSLL